MSPIMACGVVLSGPSVHLRPAFPSTALNIFAASVFADTDESAMDARKSGVYLGLPKSSRTRCIAAVDSIPHPLPS